MTTMTQNAAVTAPLGSYTNRYELGITLGYKSSSGILKRPRTE